MRECLSNDVWEHGTLFPIDPPFDRSKSPSFPENKAAHIDPIEAMLAMRQEFGRNTVA